MWFSFSRSTRTPTRAETDAFHDFYDFVTSPPFFFCPVEFGFVKDPVVGYIIPIVNNVRVSDITKSIEIGYRRSFDDKLSMDIALFHDQDDIPFDNIRNRFFGGELVIKHQPFEHWRLEYHISHTNVDADIAANSAVAGTEKTIAHIRSYYNINDQCHSIVYCTTPMQRLDLRMMYGSMQILVGQSTTKLSW